MSPVTRKRVKEANKDDENVSDISPVRITRNSALNVTKDNDSLKSRLRNHCSQVSPGKENDKKTAIDGSICSSSDENLGTPRKFHQMSSRIAAVKSVTSNLSPAKRRLRGYSKLCSPDSPENVQVSELITGDIENKYSKYNLCFSSVEDDGELYNKSPLTCNNSAVKSNLSITEHSKENKIPNNITSSAPGGINCEEHGDQKKKEKEKLEIIIENNLEEETDKQQNLNLKVESPGQPENGTVLILSSTPEEGIENKGNDTVKITKEDENEACGTHIADVEDKKMSPKRNIKEKNRIVEEENINLCLQEEDEIREYSNENVIGSTEEDKHIDGTRDSESEDDGLPSAQHVINNDSGDNENSDEDKKSLCDAYEKCNGVGECDKRSSMNDGEKGKVEDKDKNNEINGVDDGDKISIIEANEQELSDDTDQDNKDNDDDENGDEDEVEAEEEEEDEEEEEEEEEDEKHSQFIDMETEVGEETNSEEEGECEEDEEDENEDHSYEFEEETGIVDFQKLVKMFISDEAEDEDIVKRKKRKNAPLLESDEENNVLDFCSKGLNMDTGDSDSIVCKEKESLLLVSEESKDNHLDNKNGSFHKGSCTDSKDDGLSFVKEGNENLILICDDNNSEKADISFENEKIFGKNENAPKMLSPDRKGNSQKNLLSGSGKKKSNACSLGIETIMGDTCDKNELVKEKLEYQIDSNVCKTAICELGLKKRNSFEMKREKVRNDLSSVLKICHNEDLDMNDCDENRKRDERYRENQTSNMLGNNENNASNVDSCVNNVGYASLECCEDLRSELRDETQDQNTSEHFSTEESSEESVIQEYVNESLEKVSDITHEELCSRDKLLYNYNNEQTEDTELCLINTSNADESLLDSLSKNATSKATKKYIVYKDQNDSGKFVKMKRSVETLESNTVMKGKRKKMKNVLTLNNRKGENMVQEISQKFQCNISKVEDAIEKRKARKCENVKRVVEIGNKVQGVIKVQNNGENVVKITSPKGEMLKKNVKRTRSCEQVEETDVPKKKQRRKIDVCSNVQVASKIMAASYNADGWEVTDINPVTENGWIVTEVKKKKSQNLTAYWNVNNETVIENVIATDSNWTVSTINIIPQGNPLVVQNNKMSNTKNYKVLIKPVPSHWNSEDIKKFLKISVVLCKKIGKFSYILDISSKELLRLLLLSTFPKVTCGNETWSLTLETDPLWRVSVPVVPSSVPDWKIKRDLLKVLGNDVYKVTISRNESNGAIMDYGVVVYAMDKESQEIILKSSSVRLWESKVKFSEYREAKPKKTIRKRMKFVK